MDPVVLVPTGDIFGLSLSIQTNLPKIQTDPFIQMTTQHIMTTV